MNEISIVLSLPELGVVRDAIHNSTIRGVDAPVIAHILNKIYVGIDKINKSNEPPEIAKVRGKN